MPPSGTALRIPEGGTLPVTPRPCPLLEPLTFSAEMPGSSEWTRGASTEPVLRKQQGEIGIDAGAILRATRFR